MTPIERQIVSKILAIARSNEMDELRDDFKKHVKETA